MKKITIGIIAHVDSGKTTLSEALLYKSGEIRKFGRVDKGESYLDGDEMERKRGITIYSKVARFSHNETEFVMLDTPGHSDFGAEMERTLQVLDYAVLIIAATDPVNGRIKTLWRLLNEYKIPTFIFFNKMDIADTDKARLIDLVHKELSDNVIDFAVDESEEKMDMISMCSEEAMDYYLQNGNVSEEIQRELVKNRQLFPAYFGSALNMEGVDELIDDLDRLSLAKQYNNIFGARAYKVLRSENGARLTMLKITGGKLSVRDQIMDKESEVKISSMRLYSGDKFTLVTSVEAGEIVAVEGLKQINAGDGLGFEAGNISPLLIPVLKYSVSFPNREHIVTVLPHFKSLEEEIPELCVEYDEEKKELFVNVMGAIQLEILTHILKERFDLEVTFGTGRILYKETIAKPAIGVGHFEPLRHYAEAHLLLEPLPLGSGLIFDTDVSTDLLAKNWQRLILTHMAEKTHRGVLTGSPITDMKITLIAGKAHPKHTEGGDFRQATYRAIRQGLMMTESILLEPCYSFVLKLPTDSVGRALTDLDRMNAQFMPPDLDSASNMSVITGKVSVRKFADYPADVAAYTKGKGIIDICPEGYIECTDAEEIVASVGYDPCADIRNTPDSVFCSHGSGTVIPYDQVYEMKHIPFDKEKPADSVQPVVRKQTTSVSDIWLGVDEVDSIIDSISYVKKEPGSNNTYKKKRVERFAQTTNYDKTPSKSFSIDTTQYLLIDGYNVIFAWEELRKIAEINMDGAKNALLDILCNYQAMNECQLIAVFDAYKVKGHGTEFLDYHNIHVVYTKEAQTADQYIERFAHEHGKKHKVSVVTSDGIEQVIIIGAGCNLVSSREFKELIRLNSERLKENYGVK